MHVIAAKAVAFGEALQPEFKSTLARGKQCRSFGPALNGGGLDIVTGGTDTHLVLVDLRPMGLTGKDAEAAMERAGLTCSKNAVRSIRRSRRSRLEFGSFIMTNRGFGKAIQRMG